MKMNWITYFSNFLLFIMACIMFAGLSSCQKNTEVVEKPNIVIFFSDDMAPRHVSPYGKAQPTPTLQRLADSGMRFNNAYASSSMCTPSRYSLLTGNYAGRNQASDFLKDNPTSQPYTIAWNTYLTENDKTLAEWMKEAGYFTGYVGKYHLGSVKDRPVDLPLIPQEADLYAPEINETLKNYQKNLQDEVKKMTGFDYVASILWANYEENPIPERCFHNFEWMTKGAIDFLEQTDDQPFVLYSATTAIHGPNHHAALELDPHITPGGILENPTAYHPPRDSVKAELIKNGFEVSHENVGLAMLDDHIKAVLHKLEELGKADNTLILFMSDHGVEPGKASCYEVGVRIPFIANWPGKIAEGTTSNANVQICDVLPTLLQLSQFNTGSNEFDGKDFSQSFINSAFRGREYLYFENGYSRAILKNNLKYIAMRYPESVINDLKEGKYEYAPNRLNFPNQSNAQVALFYHPDYFEQDQLYNLKNDYWEQNNLARDSAYQDDMKMLKMALQQQLIRFEHPFDLEKQDFLESEEYKKLAEKSREKGVDHIYWWNPEERILPPGYH